MATDKKLPESVNPKKEGDAGENGNENGSINKINAQALRGKAEARVDPNSHFSIDSHTTDDSIQHLLHELQVHQIELEMQNEELRESHIALDAVRTRYFDLYDLAPIGYLTLSKSGIIKQANLTFASLIDMPRSNLLKQPMFKLILRADQDIYYLNRQELMESQQPQSFDLRIVKNDHTPVWVNLLITLSKANNYSNSDALEIWVVVNDITVRKQNEQALQEAMQVAEKANLAKSVFLSSMSHELRTPLNSVLGFAQLLEAGLLSPTPTQKRNIEQILKSGWYLLELINEILDLAVIDSGKVLLHIETFSLADVLNEAKAMLENQAQQRDITMIFPHADITYFVQADRVRIKQVFANLLSNAVKYNKSSGSITVTYIKQNDQRIRVCIEDTGNGLSEQNIAQLFQPFNRLGQESSKEQGTGIGLVVSKKIVELMGGSIGVNSTVGVGSTFWVELNCEL